MEPLRVINYVIMAVFCACYAYQFFYIPVAWLSRQKPLPEGKLHRYAVLIAARNEAAVIGDLIDSLKRQEYPADLVDIYVVADNCTDCTANVAESHGATVFERFDGARVGKGYALNFLLGKIEERCSTSCDDCQQYDAHQQYDAYLVFDADNAVDPSYIREINKTFSAGYDIVTSYRNSKNFGDNWISSGYGLWFLHEAQYLNRPRAALGASCSVSGTGFLFSRRILERCGGWNFFLLTEDVEFTAHNIVNGEIIGYCPAAVFYDEQPTRLGQSVRQRVRWAQGYLQVLRRYGGRLVKGWFRGSFSCFDMLMGMAPAAVLVWAAVLVNVASVILRCVNGDDAPQVAVSLGLIFLNLYLAVFALGLITTISEWRRIRCSAGRKVMAAVTFPLFVMTYLPVTAAALVCKPSWEPIEHGKRGQAEGAEGSEGSEGSAA